MSKKKKREQPSLTNALPIPLPRPLGAGGTESRANDIRYHLAHHVERNVEAVGVRIHAYLGEIGCVYVEDVATGAGYIVRITVTPQTFIGAMFS